MHSLTDKGIKKAILGLTLSGKGNCVIQSSLSFLSGVPVRSTSLLAHIAESKWSWQKLKTQSLSVLVETVHPSITLKCRTLKKVKENSIMQRLIIQCVDYSGLLLCSPLPLALVIRSFHCSLAERKRKEIRGKVELANFSIYEQVPREGVQTMGSRGSSGKREDFEEVARELKC